MVDTFQFEVEQDYSFWTDVNYSFLAMLYSSCIVDTIPSHLIFILAMLRNTECFSL